MRWTDLPGDPEPAGGRDRAVLQRGEWQDLRRRLERLPAGHPSSPGDDGDTTAEARAAEARADAAWTDDGEVGGRGADQWDGDQWGGDQDSARQAGDQRADGEARAGPDRRSGPDQRTGPDEHTGPGRYHAGLTPGPDRREPYQPWFASGDWPDPWFSPDPDP
jgi:hypothetical protein